MNYIKYIYCWCLLLGGILSPMLSTAQTNISLGGSCVNCTAMITSFANCAADSSGSLEAGVFIGTGVTQTIVVNVAKVGQYHFTTTANGVTFKADGTLTGIGSQTIVLTASGKPTTVGSTIFTLSSGTQNCTFRRLVSVAGAGTLAPAPQVAAVCPTSLRFKQITIQWGLTLDGDVYGWNSVLEGKTVSGAFEPNAKTLTFTKVQNQPGKISKLMTCRVDKNAGSAAAAGASEVEFKPFLLGQNGNIYAIERQKDVSGTVNGNQSYASPTNLTFIGNAGSGNTRNNTNFQSVYVEDSRLVIRQFPASPSGSKWKDIEVLTDLYGTGTYNSTIGGMPVYGMVALDSAGRLYACTWYSRLVSSVPGIAAYTTAWKEIPIPAGAAPSFQYSKLIEHNAMGVYSHNQSPPSVHERGILLEGNDGNVYAFSALDINRVAHATAFSNTLAKKIPMPTGKNTRKYWNIDIAITNPNATPVVRTAFIMDLLMTDGSLYTYDYLANTLVEIVRPKSSTTIIDYVPITQNVVLTATGLAGIVGVTQLATGKGMILTNEGIYENGNNPFFSWKANPQSTTAMPGDADLLGGWRRPRPEYDFKTLFQQVDYFNPDGAFKVFSGSPINDGASTRTIKRALFLDASGKAYMATRMNGRGDNTNMELSVGGFDGLRETGVFVNELMSGACDDNNPYPEP